MKTSNYILIAVFTLVIISILTFFITSEQNENEHYQIKEEVITLPDFKVIVVEDTTEFNIHSGEENRLSIRYSENRLRSGEIFRVINDTLYVNIKNTYSANIFCKQVVSVIVLKNSMVHINNSKFSQMTVENRGGHVDLYGNTFDTLRIHAIDSAGIDLYGNHAKFVSAELKDLSHFFFNGNHFDKMDIRLEIKK